MKDFLGSNQYYWRLPYYYLCTYNSCKYKLDLMYIYGWVDGSCFCRLFIHNKLLFYSKSICIILYKLTKNFESQKENKSNLFTTYALYNKVISSFSGSFASILVNNELTKCHCLLEGRFQPNGWYHNGYYNILNDIKSYTQCLKSILASCWTAGAFRDTWWKPNFRYQPFA